MFVLSLSWQIVFFLTKLRFSRENSTNNRWVSQATRLSESPVRWIGDESGAKMELILASL
jgi:hypothetical protein